jgi:aspartate racemase
MKTIGVLGGLGPQATMDFEARVHRASQKVIPAFTNSGYPPMVVYYYRAAPMLLDEKHHPIIPLVPDPRLFEAAARLRGMADFFVIPSNTPHVFRDQLEKAAGCPLLSIIETTIAEVERRGLKRVGLVGFGDPKVYTEPMKAKGIATETLASKEELDLRAQIDGAILALMEGRLKPEAQALVRKAIEIVRGRGTETVVLACSELPLLLGKDADESSGLINPTQLLAEAAVRRAIDEG